jgi:hypothetical protein
MTMSSRGRCSEFSSPALRGRYLPVGLGSHTQRREQTTMNSPSFNPDILSDLRGCEPFQVRFFEHDAVLATIDPSFITLFGPSLVAYRSPRLADPPLWRVCRPNIAIKKAVRLTLWIPETENLLAPGQLIFCSAAPYRWPADPWYRWWMKQDAGTVRALLQCQVRAWSLHLAQLCCSGGLNLLQENPALALAIAMQAPQAFPDLLLSTRAHLLRRLGFPSRPAPAIMNVLQRVEPKDLSPKFLVRLRASLKEPAVLRKLYGGRSRIDRVCLSLLRPEVRDYVTPDLLAEVADHGALHAQEFEDLLATATELGTQISRPLRSLRDLESLLDELRESVEGAAVDSCPLPPEPLPGMIVQQRGVRFVIEPITTVKGIRLEGVQQRNCSESLIPDIRAGYMYLYRAVFEAHDGRRVRITIAIQRSSQDWIINDIRARANRRPDDDVVQACEAWIQDGCSLKCYL